MPLDFSCIFLYENDLVLEGKHSTYIDGLR